MTTDLPGGIDGHAHVFTRRLPRVAAARYVPSRDASIFEYLKLLDATALGGGVLVQPSFLGTDNSYMLGAIAVAPSRLRAVAVVDPDVTAQELDRLAASGVVGLRFNLIGTRTPSLAHVAAAGLLREIARRGWHIEVQAEGQDWPSLLPEVLAGGARLVVDHFGRPTPALGVRCPGFQAILHAARDHDVWVKMSAPYRFGGAHAAACADALLDATGGARLVWGSDWPWTQHPEITDYAATFAWLRDWVRDPAVRERVLRDNPKVLFGFA